MWQGQAHRMPRKHEAIPSDIPIGSSTYKSIVRSRKHDRINSRLAKEQACDEMISWETQGLKTLDEALNTVTNDSAQLENGWSVPQCTIAIRYNKSLKAKPTCGFSSIEEESRSFISLWESRGYVNLRGPIGTAKAIFGITEWICSGSLPQIRALVDETSFQLSARDGSFYYRRRIISFISVSLHANVAVQFTSYIDAPVDIPKTLFIKALHHLDGVIPHFQSASSADEGYMEIPEHQTTEPWFETWRKSLVFRVFEDAKTYVKEQLTSVFSHYGNKIFLCAVGAVISVIAFALLGYALARMVAAWAFGTTYEDTIEHQGKGDRKTPASEDEYIPVISDVTSALTRYMNAPLANVNLWSKQIALMGSQLRSIEYLMTFVVTKFSTIVDFISVKVFGSPFFESSKLVVWAPENVPRLTKELDNLNSTQLTRVKSERVVAIYRELSKMSMIYAGMGPMALSVKNSVDFVLRDYKPMYSSALQAVHAPTTRVEPVWIYLMGPPNMGKSTFAYALASAVHKEFYGSFEETDVYPLNEENEYFDGFYGQKILFIDEHLSKKATVDRCGIANNMIHMVNSMPHPVISAAIEDKGKHWVDCDLVITTNNDTAYPQDLGLKEPGAYYRRRTLVLELFEREGDNYSFKLHPIEPSKKGYNLQPLIVSGGQATQMTIDAIKDKRATYERLKGKATTPEGYILPSGEYFRMASTKEEAKDGIKSKEAFKYKYAPVTLPKSMPKEAPDSDPDQQDIFYDAEEFPDEEIEHQGDSDSDDDDGTGISPPLTTTGLFNPLNRTRKSIDPPPGQNARLGISIKNAIGDVVDGVDKTVEQPNIPTESYAGVVKDVLGDVHYNDLFKPLTKSSLYEAEDHEAMRKARMHTDWANQFASDGDFFSVVADMDRLSVPSKRAGLRIPAILTKDFYTKYSNWLTGGRNYDQYDQIDTYLASFPLQYKVTATYANMTHFKNWVAMTALPPINLEEFIRITEGQVTYGDLWRIVSGIPPEDNNFMHKISANGQAFMIRWLRGTMFFFSLLTVDEHVSFSKLHPHHYPKETEKSPALFKTNLNTARTVWEAKFGLSRAILDRLRDPVWLGAMTIAAAALAGLATVFIKWMTSSGLSITKEIESQSDNKHMNNVLKRTLRANKRQRKNKHTVTIESQSGEVPEYHSLNMGMVDRVANNVEHIVIHYDDGTMAAQFCLFLKGAKFATASHAFYKKDKKVVKVIFSFASTMPIDVNFSSLVIKHDPARDLVFVTIKNFAVMFSDITKNGYLSSQEARPSEGTLGLNRIQFTSDGTLHLMQGGALMDFAGETGKGSEKTSLVSCHKLAIPGQKGMCGLPYVFDNTKVKFICGIHVAGTDFISIIAPIYISDIEEESVPIEQQCAPYALGDYVLPDPELLKQFKPNAKTFVITDKALPCPLGVRTVAETNFNFVGPSVTKLARTLLAEDGKHPFQDNLAPARLKPFVNAAGETISPLNVSFKKFENKRLKELPDEFRHPDVVKGVFTPDKPWQRLRELTIEEAINGVPEWGNCHCIDMKTSAGVGYVNHGIKRKELFYKKFSQRYGKEIYLPIPVLLAQIEAMVAQVRAGKIPRCMALGLLKDEKRPKSRVEAGASRLFYAADLVHLIVSRIFLGGLLSASETNPSQSDVMVGINPLGPEWHMLFKRISNASTYALTSTDIEGWDINFILYTVGIFCMLLAYNFPKLPPAYLMGVHCMLWSSTMPFVFIGNKVFWMFIMCSGTLATSWFNTVANSMLHRGLFKRMINDFVESEEFAGLPEANQDFISNISFDSAIRGGFFGDDNTQGVHPMLQEVYNGQTLAKYRLDILNWVTTDPMKGKDIKKFDSYEDTVLLKRFFRDDSGIVKGALDKTTIEGMLLWFTKGENPDYTQQAINIHVALRESYFWGEQYFTEMRKIVQPYIIELSARSGIDHSFPATYDDLDRQFQDGW